MGIYEILPDSEVLLALEPEELAGVVLEYLNTLPDGHQDLNRYNFSLPHVVEKYPDGHRKEISVALMEAWAWLEREALVVHKPGSEGKWSTVSRRGKKIKNRQGLESYRRANMLPKESLHPSISTKVWATFLRGDYDTAVFQSFKEVEVAVRRAGGYGPGDIGVPLMRKAFHTEDGPLTNTRAEGGERQALSDLFSGAIGSYKNPNSHRDVEISPQEAIEMITLASHLLRIVDSRNRQ